jgi:uncharacterized protein DUF1236
MRRLVLASAAMASLAIGLATAQAQQAQDHERMPAASRSQQSTGHAADQKRNRASARDQRSSSQTGTTNNRMQRDALDARAQKDNASPGQTEPLRSNQARERSGDRVRRDTRDRTQRNQARDARRDFDQRSRASRERIPAREATTTGQSRADRTIESRRANDSLRSDRSRRERVDRRQDTARGSIVPSDSQRTRVSSRFAARLDRLNVPALSRSRLSVSIGAIVPSTIRLYDVPVDIVDIYPGFRGHKFVVVDDEVVIIEPRTRRVMTTIPLADEALASGSLARSTTGSAPSGERIRLLPEQRTIIRDTLLQEPVCHYEQRLEFFLVIPFPTTVRVCEFPERVVSEVPAVSRYRYVTRGEEVLIVDPEEQRVVEVIE